MTQESHFKYSTTIHAHEADVRGVFPCSDGQLLTCSRDMTAKVWKQGENHHYVQSKCFRGHKSFVSCVLFVPPDANHRNGIVVTGGNDHKILIFDPITSELVACLSGHTNTVCSLFAGKSGNLVSASWDKSVKVWPLSDLHMVNTKCLTTYTGHNAAVWDVVEMPRKKCLVVTASADKTIKLWKEKHCVFTLTDHTDCVRGLAVVSGIEFLSCSNDTTVKRWSVEGNCLQTYQGHRSFVYSVLLLGNGQEFVTCGEDRTIRVWQIGESHPMQTIPTPATSVWKAVELPNGDIAGACSDSTVRVFTKSKERFADADSKVTYEEELATAQLPASANKDLQNDINLDELPGVEGLQQPGSKDGQTKLIRNGSNVEVYQWSMADKDWLKVGNMVGSGASSDRKKTMYKGKEYDYLFTIDIAEGKPPLNLPYNVTEDPYVAAQNFIDKENLSQSFLETIANFIIENADVTAAPASSSSGYQDPFTGGGRYVPGEVNGSQTGGADPFTGGGRYIPGSTTSPSKGPVNKADPFTGGGRYIPNGNDSEAKGSGKNDSMVNPSRYVAEPESMDVDQSVQVKFSSKNVYFPKEDFIFFTTANSAAMLGKLKELTACDVLSESTFETLSKILEGSQKPDEVSAAMLWKLINGDPKVIYPALDLFRLLLVKHPELIEMICDSKAEELLFLLLSFIDPSSDLNTNNRLLAIRILSHLAASNDGIAFLIAGHEKILSAVSSDNFLSTTSLASGKNIQISNATLFLNYAVLLTRKNPDSVTKHCEEACVSAIPLLLKCIDSHGNVNSEAAFRYLVALGTLLYNNDVAQTIARSLNATNVVNHVRKAHSSMEKVKRCSEHLLVLL